MLTAERGSLAGFDLAVLAEPPLDLAACEAIGATWTMWSFRPGATARDVMTRITSGPG